MTVTASITPPVRSVEGMLPGPELASLLAAVDLSAVDEFEVVEVLKAGRRLASWAASIEVMALAELERRTVASEEQPCGVDAAEFVTCEVEAALTLTSLAAGNLMHIARSLTERLPATLAALTDGRIDIAKARVICDGTHLTSPEVSGFVENVILPLAPPVRPDGCGPRSAKPSSSPTPTRSRTSGRTRRHPRGWSCGRPPTTQRTWPGATCS